MNFIFSFSVSKDKEFDFSQRTFWEVFQMVFIVHIPQSPLNGKHNRLEYDFPSHRKFENFTTLHIESEN
jgi:hypothetical protein